MLSITVLQRRQSLKQTPASHKTNLGSLRNRFDLQNGKDQGGKLWVRQWSLCLEWSLVHGSELRFCRVVTWRKRQTRQWSSLSIQENQAVRPSDRIHPGRLPKPLPKGAGDAAWVRCTGYHEAL